MSGEVFVSYAREDAAWVERLAAALAARGVSLWWDRRLLAGQSFEALIDGKLQDAPAVLVVWSAASVASDWVKDEAAEGRAAGRLVPVSMGGVRPPFGFRQIHTPDFSAWDGAPDAPQIDDLIEVLSAVGVQGARAETPSVSLTPPGARDAEREETWFVPRDLRPGEEIAQFRIVRKLGQGGFGAAYEACNVHNESERVVVKVLLPDMSARESFADILKSEADALQRVKHDAVVQYRTFGRLRASDEFFLAVEYIDGPTLAEWRRTNTPTMGQILSLAARLKSGLDAVHAQGVVHRDLSPDNVILPGGRLDKATIIDFGIAKHGAIDRLAGGFAGKLSWASPEQLDPGLGAVGPWTDFYSLGLILAFLARGSKLPIGGSMEAARSARESVPDLKDVPSDLAAIIAGLLQRDPGARRAAFDGETSTTSEFTSPPDGDETAARPVAGRRRLPMLAVGAVLAVLAAIATAVLLRWGGPSPDTAGTPRTDVVAKAAPVAEPAPDPEPTSEPDSPALLQLPEHVRPVARRAEAVAKAAREVELRALKASAEALDAFVVGDKARQDGARVSHEASDLVTRYFRRCDEGDFVDGNVFCRKVEEGGKTLLWVGEGRCTPDGCVLDGKGHHSIDGYPYWEGRWREGRFVEGVLWVIGMYRADDSDLRPDTSWRGNFDGLVPHGFASSQIGAFISSGLVEQGEFKLGCVRDMGDAWVKEATVKRNRWVCGDFRSEGYGSYQETEIADLTPPRAWSDDYFTDIRMDDFILARFVDLKPVGPLVMHRRDGSRVETARDGDDQGVGVVTFKDGSRYVGELNHNAAAHGLGALYDKDGELVSAGRWREGAPAI